MENKALLSIFLPGSIPEMGWWRIALKADETVAFGWEKIGTVYPEGTMGNVTVADIGFPEALWAEPEENLWT